MKYLRAGSATRSRASEFNKIRYNDSQLKIKYKDYISLGGYGSTKLEQSQFTRIWQIRENEGLSALDISKKITVGEQTVRHVLRFLERENSIIKNDDDLDFLVDYNFKKQIERDIKKSKKYKINKKISHKYFTQFFFKIEDIVIFIDFRCCPRKSC